MLVFSLLFKFLNIFLNMIDRDRVFVSEGDMICKLLSQFSFREVLIVLCFLFNAELFAQTNSATEVSESLDIEKLPRLSADLPEGTVAWATLDQLHPTQPQTGKREVLHKIDMFKDAMKDDGKKFSKDFFKLAQKQMAPAYIAKTPIGDSRYGKEPVLAYITDRTHGSSALSELYVKKFGPEALSKPLFDKKGRPLNYVLVKVSGNKTAFTEAQFKDFMVKENHTYLENWTRGKKGETLINKISFDQLPEKVIQTTDKPWRAYIGELQDEGLRKVAVDYSQFKMAKKLNASGEVTWDDLTSSEKKYEHAKEKGMKFFKKNPACLDSLLQAVLAN